MRATSITAAAREIALDVALTTGLLPVLNRLTRQGGVSLLYHSVADGPRNPYLGQAAFRSQMEMLRTEFQVLGAEESFWYFRRGRSLPSRSVLITFDDGYRNNCTVVQPIMESLGLPWLLFSATQGVDGPDAALWMTLVRAVCQFSPEPEIAFGGRVWSLSDGRVRVYKQIARWSSSQPSRVIEDATRALMDERRQVIPGEYFESFCALMSAEELRDLARSDLVTIGAHTHTHPFLPRVSSERLDLETVGAKHRLEEICGRPVKAFAYPSGKYGSRELAKVEDAGYECAFAVIPQVGTTYRYEVPRVGVYGGGVPSLHAKCLGAASMLRTLGFQVG
jgi:peptidoglycan/xylan/chitin deacetylase (PgdA/CDA1 family)